MNRPELAQYYKDNAGLIHTVALKGHRRLMAMGASYDYDDLFQDLTVVFIRAFDGFDDNAGFKFSSYFMTSAYHKVNQIAEGVKTERIDMGMRSAEEMCNEDEEGETLNIKDGSPTPYDIVEAASSLKDMLAEMSPLATSVLALTLDPPEFIEREFAATAAHARHAREGGTEKRAKQSISVSFVCSVLEKTRSALPLELRKARLEIGAAAKRSFA